MKHTFFPTVLVAMVAFMGQGAAGASLGLTPGSPILTAPDAFIDYLEFGPDGDLSTFGAVVASAQGTLPDGFTEIGFGVGFSLSDPTLDATGGFDVFDESGFYLGGELAAVGFFTDSIELQFDVLGGSGAADFGSSVLAVITFGLPLGDTPFQALFDGDSIEASITLSGFSPVTPVPLPPGLLLLIVGLSGMGLLRRQKADA